jgi:menaquinone-dependent protoporphyrinogen oxidase
MEIIIVYAGNTGSTEKVAGMLNQRLKNVRVVNLLHEEPDISEYDVVVIGSNVRFGRLQKKVKNFITKNESVILEKKVAYYICCGFSDKYKEHFENNVPKELLNSAITYDTFGGEMDIEKQKGFDKFIVKMVSKTEAGKKEIKILTENIEEFAKKINEIAR